MFKTLRLKPTTLDEFKTKWAAIQSVMTIVAIVLGAGWAFYTFLIQRQDRVEAMNPVIDLGIKAKQLSLPNDAKPYLAVVVTLKNVGTSNFKMCFEDPENKGKTRCPDNDQQSPEDNQINWRPALPTINVARYRYDDQKKGVIFNRSKDTLITVTEFRADDPETESSGFVLRAGGTITRTAVVQVPEPGLYRVAFSVLLPQRDTQLHLARKPFLGVSMFCVVADHPPKTESENQCAGVP
jgi:hypothetical protein